MGSSLARVIPHVDTDKMVSAVAKFSKKYGVAIGRATWNGGRTAIKVITTHGAQVVTTIVIPEVKSKIQRDNLIKDLHKLGFNQETTAAIMRTSQSTVSRVLRK